MLGTLTASAGANVGQSAAVPANVLNVAQQGTALYGLFTDNTVKPLGTFPTLTSGATLANIVAPADRADPTAYAGVYFAANATHLLAGYTKAGAGFPGNVALVQPSDAGVQYVNAPGNYSAAGCADGFVINGLGLGTLTGTGASCSTPSTRAPRRSRASIRPGPRAAASPR